MRPLLLLPVLLLSACGASPAATPTPSEDSLAAGGTTQADNDLTVEVDRGDGSPVETWTLSCLDSPTGTHPQPGAACAHLQEVEEPFEPVPEDAVCTEQYGGPQTARVFGVWDGEPVDLSLSRHNGCYIWQWELLVPLVPDVS